MQERIGPYEINRELGRGGMGVVYLATDTRLDRQVAIKALPAELASDPARLERFEREAKLLASLNHPNLAGIHGVEEQDGAKYLVLEFVEGETLADMLDRGPLPVEDTMELAVQIAAGVEAAHEAGVIHRDLKPANIIVTPDGKAKVLDFGLARTDEGGQSSTGALDSPTMTTPHPQHSPTIEGAILGTAAYMSPEQARGRRVDKRTDIWSFGVVLYEMLTGASPFVGETVTDSIGAVLHKDLNLDQLPEETPPSVRLVLQRCLQRDKNLRYRDIGDARLDLLNPVVPRVSQAKQRSVLPWAVALAAFLLLVATLAVSLTSSPGPEHPALPKVDFEVQIPISRTQFSVSPSVAIARDGQSIAVQADKNGGFEPIYVRHLDQGALRRVETRWPEEPELIRWTHDGGWLIVLKGSATTGELWKISPYGEAPRLICPLPDKGFIWADSVDYIDDETLVVGLALAGLWTVPERGGRLKPFEPAADGEILVQPRLLPDSDTMIFFEINGGTLELLVDGERRTLFDFDGDRLSRLEIAPDGTILFSLFSGSYSRGTYRLEFDLNKLEVTDDPLLIYPFGDTDIAENGTLVVGPRLITDPVMRDLVWVNADGTVSETVTSGLPNAMNVSLSPDSSRAATSLISSSSLGQDELDYDIAVIDLSNGSRYELRNTTGSDYYPFWTPDGESLIYATYNAGIRRSHLRPASGAGQPETVFELSVITRPSDDGEYLLSNSDQFYYRKTGDTGSTVISQNPTYDFDLSSTSAYLASSLEDAGDGVLLQRFPEGGGLTTVTTMDAVGINWSHDDSKLYFWADGAFWETPVDISGVQPNVGQPKKLFRSEDTGIVQTRIYGIGTDGRFLMLRDPEDRPESPETLPIRIIQGWMDGRTRSR